jgi:hypothetical protein
VVTPQAIWPTAKYLLIKDRPKTPTAINGRLCLKFYPSGKAKAIADCLENQFTPHDSRDKDHKRRVEARVQALLKATDNSPMIE